MTAGKPTNDLDSDLFRAAVGKVKVLENDRHDPPGHHPKAIRRPQKPVFTGSDHMFPDDPCPEAPGFAQSQFFTRPGVQKRLLRRLTRGQIPRDAEVDLHGMSVNEARCTLAAFMEESHYYRYRCVCIIHGKGYRSPRQTPVIKALVDRWLKLNNSVLAFCSAQPRDGGTGALYVLLKPPRPDNRRSEGA